MPNEPPSLPPGGPAPTAGRVPVSGIETPGLHIYGVGKSFGRRAVLQDVNFSVHRGEVAGLLGPNGAGKTTCFYIITGLVKPDTGLIYLDGNNLTDTPMYQRARMGISYLAQEASIFRGMSVEQNILSVAELHERDGRRAKALVDGLLEELHIAHLRKAAAVSLSGGERRRVEIARALATEPSFLLMDEPFAGLDPLAVDDIRKIVIQLKNRGLGILITDHNVKETLDIVDVASVIYDGSVLLEGAPQEILSDPEVRRVYLGKAYAETLEQNHAPAPAAQRKRRFRPPETDLPATEWTALSEEAPVKKSTVLMIFGAGAVAGLALGLGLGATVLKPKAPVAGAEAQQSAGATGARYDKAFTKIDEQSLWNSAEIGWRHLPSGSDAGAPPVTFTMPTTPYGYGGISHPIPPDLVPQEVIVRVDVREIRGRIGASLVNPAGKPILTEEQGLPPTEGQRSLFFRLTPKQLPAAVLFRNYGDTSGKPGSITVTGLSYAPVGDFSNDQLEAISTIGLNKPLP